MCDMQFGLTAGAVRVYGKMGSVGYLIVWDCFVVGRFTDFICLFCAERSNDHDDGDSE